MNDKKWQDLLDEECKGEYGDICVMIESLVEKCLALHNSQVKEERQQIVNEIINDLKNEEFLSRSVNCNPTRWKELKKRWMKV